MDDGQSQAKRDNGDVIDWDRFRQRYRLMEEGDDRNGDDGLHQIATTKDPTPPVQKTPVEIVRESFGGHYMQPLTSNTEIPAQTKVLQTFAVETAQRVQFRTVIFASSNSVEETIKYLVTHCKVKWYLICDERVPSFEGQQCMGIANSEKSATANETKKLKQEKRREEEKQAELKQLDINKRLLNGGAIALALEGKIANKDYLFHKKGTELLKADIEMERRLANLRATPRFLPNPWALPLKIYELEEEIKLRCYWLYAENGGLGKSTKFMRFMKQHFSCFVRKGGAETWTFWDAYRDEEIVVFDEYNEPYLKATALNNFGDCDLEMRIPATGGRSTRPARFRACIILSNHSIAELYPKQRNQNLLKLRFNEIQLEPYRLTPYQQEQLKQYNETQQFDEMLTSGNLNNLFEYDGVNGLGDYAAQKCCVTIYGDDDEQETNRTRRSDEDDDEVKRSREMTKYHFHSPRENNDDNNNNETEQIITLSQEEVTVSQKAGSVKTTTKTVTISTKVTPVKDPPRHVATFSNPSFASTLQKEDSIHQHTVTKKKDRGDNFVESVFLDDSNDDERQVIDNKDCTPQRINSPLVNTLHASKSIHF
ncbi:unnamed protein product [Sphagnum balticum]